MIDEKGRLFGKINVVDLLVILVIVIAAAVLAVKFLVPSTVGGGAAGGKTKVTYTVLVENVQPEVYDNILEHIPSTLMASGELLDGQVVGVTAQPRSQEAVVGIGSSSLSIGVNKENLDLTFTIECNVVNPITTEVGTQEVRIGKTHIVKTDKFELTNGTILSCVWGDGSAA